MSFENLGQLSDWILPVMGIIFLTYSAIHIKNEKHLYLKTAKSMQLKYFKLLIPKWWSVFEYEANEKVKFKRHDTNYDWFAEFKWGLSEEDLNSAALAKKFINEMKISFDEKVELDIQNKTFKNNNHWQLTRIEGMASENLINRVYLDLAILKKTNSLEYLLCLSRSSILNGSVEGPYFDEVLKRIEPAMD